MNALTICAYINNVDGILNADVKAYLSDTSNVKASESVVSVMHGLNNIELCCKYLVKLKEESALTVLSRSSIDY